MAINFNSASPDGQRQLQQEGVEIVSNLPYLYESLDEIPQASQSSDQGEDDFDQFLEDLSTAFGFKANR